MPDLTPTQALVYSAIQRAADAGADCPTNTQLFELLGCGISQGSDIIAALERKGVIAVQRGNSRRVVTVLATGKRTAGEVKDTHWRNRPENRARLAALRAPRSPVLHALDEPPREYVDRSPCFFCGARPDACECQIGKRA